jgi:chromosome segregation ATPase
VCDLCSLFCDLLLRALTEQLEDLRETARAWEGRCAVLTQQVAVGQLEIENAHTELRRARAALTTTHEQLQEMTAQRQQCAQLERSEIQLELRAANARAAELEESVHHTHTELQAAQALLLEEGRAHALALTNAERELNTSRARLQRAQEELGVATAQRLEERDALASLRGEVESALEERAAAERKGEAALERAKSAEQCIGTLTDRLAEAMVDLEEHQDELEAVREELRSVGESDRAAMNASVEVATQSRLALSVARRELAVAREQLEASHAERESLQASVHSAEGEVACLRESVRSAETEVESARAEHERLYEEWAAANERRAEALHAQQREEDDHSASLEGELSAAQAQLRVLRSSLESARAAESLVRARGFGEGSACADQLSEELSEARRQLARSGEALEAEQLRCRERDRCLEAAEEELERVRLQELESDALQVRLAGSGGGGPSGGGDAWHTQLAELSREHEKDMSRLSSLLQEEVSAHATTQEQLDDAKHALHTLRRKQRQQQRRAETHEESTRVQTAELEQAGALSREKDLRTELRACEKKYTQIVASLRAQLANTAGSPGSPGKADPRYLPARKQLQQENNVLLNRIGEMATQVEASETHVRRLKENILHLTQELERRDNIIRQYAIGSLNKVRSGYAGRERK